MGPLFFFVLGVVFVALLALIASRFTGFAAQRPSDYASDVGERFDMRKHLNGPLVCEGVIYGPTGRISTRFVGDFDVRWDGDTGVMTETFHYDDGDVQHREWTITLSEDGRIVAKAPDVIGDGTGQQSGPSVRMRYRIKLPEESGGHVLSAIDWMYLAPNGTIVNRSQFRKFGIKVAELVATMRKKEG